MDNTDGAINLKKPHLWWWGPAWAQWAGAALALESAPVPAENTELAYHLLVPIGGLIFAAGVFIVMVVLFHRFGLPLAAFMGRVALPILFTGLAAMALFAFLGWAAGQRLLVTQLVSLAGAFMGLVAGGYLFGRREGEGGPISMSDFR